MHSLGTIPALRTEPRQIEFAKLPPHMPFTASRPLLTETFIVVLAQGQSRLLLDVQIEALIAVLAVAVLVVELALAHLAEVVLMQVVAVVTLHAQGFEPMLADVVVVLTPEVVVAGGLLLRRGGVSIWTSSAEGTVSGCEGGTDGCGGDEGVAVVAAEEGGEGEGWGIFGR